MSIKMRIVSQWNYCAVRARWAVWQHVVVISFCIYTSMLWFNVKTFLCANLYSLYNHKDKRTHKVWHRQNSLWLDTHIHFIINIIQTFYISFICFSNVYMSVSQVHRNFLKSLHPIVLLLWNIYLLKMNFLFSFIIGFSYFSRFSRQKIGERRN